jgi:hypothetical protein
VSAIREYFEGLSQREEIVQNLIQFIYDSFGDDEIERILTAFHQDLGREGLLFCEVCNNDPYHNFGPNADKHFPVSETVLSAIKERLVETGKKQSAHINERREL